MRRQSFIEQHHFQIYDKIIPVFRLICLLLLVGILLLKGNLWNNPQTIWFLIAYAIYTLLLLFFKKARLFIVLKHPFVIGICEMMLASYGLSQTGGSQSPLYFTYIFVIAFYGITFDLVSSMVVSSCCSLFFIAAVLLTGEEITARLITQILFLVAFAVFIGLLSGKISKYNVNMATLDQLTALHNRRYFMNEAKLNLARSKESNFPIYLVVIDVDYFKEINDRLGHLEGDKILHNIGLILRNSVREGSLAARYGGDEFVLLLGGMDSANILPFCERLEHTIQSELSGVSVSIGYAAYPADGEQVEDLFQSADMAMYQRKQSKKTQKEQ